MYSLKLIPLLFFVLIIANFGCNDNKKNSTPPEKAILATLQVDTWTWIPKENMFSRSGRTTGYMASINPKATKLVIYFQGGGACFNPLACKVNADAFGAIKAKNTMDTLHNALMFNRVNPKNQFADWNYIFVPYSTGDVHSGNNNAGIVTDTLKNQQMIGAENFKIILKDLQAYFKEKGMPDEIMVAGSSAGGFGVYLNFIQVAETFGTNITLTGLVDSGPVFSDTTLFTACLNEQWTTLWKFKYPKDFDDVVKGTYPYDFQKVYEYLALKYPNANFGLTSRYGDHIIRGFYGFGKDGCTGERNTFSKPIFKKGLLDLQKTLVNFPNWKVFFTAGTKHTFLRSSTLGDTIDETNLNDWIAQVRVGKAVDLME